MWGQEQISKLVNSDDFVNLSVEDLVSKLESMMGDKGSNWPDQQIIKQSGWESDLIIIRCDSISRSDPCWSSSSHGFKIESKDSQVSESVSQSASKSISQSVNQLVCHSASQPTSQLVS